MTITHYGPYGSVMLPTGPTKRKRMTKKGKTQTPAPEPVAAPPAAGTKKPRKPRQRKPPVSVPTFPQMAGRKSKAPVTEKTFLRMSQRPAKMTGARGTLRKVTAKTLRSLRRHRGAGTPVLGKRSKVRVLPAHTPSSLWSKAGFGVRPSRRSRLATSLTGTRFRRRALVGVGLAGAAAAATLIIRRRNKKRRSQR